MGAGRAALGLAGWLAVTFVAAGLGAIASSEAPEFYRQLSRPAWAPPAGVFAPAWTTLYVLMGLAAWLTWRGGGWRAAAGPLVLYLVQLAANALWSWVFFVGRQGALAFVEILLLWTLVAATVVAFWRVRPLGGALLLPYLAWVTFAAALTYSVWQRNPTLL